MHRAWCWAKFSPAGVKSDHCQNVWVVLCTHDVVVIAFAVVCTVHRQARNFKCLLNGFRSLANHCVYGGGGVTFGFVLFACGLFWPHEKIATEFRFVATPHGVAWLPRKEKREHVRRTLKNRFWKYHSFIFSNQAANFNVYFHGNAECRSVEHANRTKCASEGAHLHLYSIIFWLWSLLLFNMRSDCNL